MNKELEFLKYFYKEVRSALGPASEEIYDLIKQDFLDINNYLPETYTLEDSYIESTESTEYTTW